MRRRQTLALAAALAVAAGSLYLPALGFGFVRADDTRLIVENAAFLSDLSNLPDTFRRSYFEVAGEVTGERTYYRPVVIASLMLDAQLGGTSPFVYHVTNIVIHLLAVWLLFALLLRLSAPGRAGGAPVEARAGRRSGEVARTSAVAQGRAVAQGFSPAIEAAFVAALLFAAHPVNVQAVAWIPGRNDPLMTVFALGSFLALVSYVARPSGAALLLHAAGFALALFTKETALVLLVPFLLYSRWWLGRPLPARQRTRLRLAYAAVMAVWFALRRAALGGGVLGFTAGEYATVVASNLGDQLLYIGKAVIPLNLNTMPGLTPVLAVQAAVGSAALVGLWVFVARGTSGSSPRALFTAAWFAAPLVPGLLVVALPAYEHRAYLPLAGLAIAAALAYARLVVRQPRAVRTIAAAICVALFALSFRHLDTFRDPLAYWGRAAEGTPHAPTAHVNLGALYEERDDLERAEFHYRQALALDPSALMANNNLGVVMMRTGRPAEAEDFFRRELALHPFNVQAHYNLGLYYAHVGRLDEAVPHWLRAIELDPYYLDAYVKLAELYQARGDEARAAAYREKIRALEDTAR